MYRESPPHTQADGQQFQPSVYHFYAWKHSSSRRTRQVFKDVRRLSLDEAESFASDQVTNTPYSPLNSYLYTLDIGL